MSRKILPLFIVGSCVGLILLTMVGVSSYLFLSYKHQRIVPSSSGTVDKKLTYAESCEDLQTHVEAYRKLNQYGGSVEDRVFAPNLGMKAESNTGAAPYHTNTNVQVAGIDEGDSVKTDGTTLYTLDQNTSSIKISKVFPYNESKKIGEISFRTTNRVVGLDSPIEMFLSDKTLIVFTNTYSYHFENYPDTRKRDVDSLILPSGNLITTYIYDVSNPASPREIRKVEVEGNFVTSRLKDGRIYLVTNNYMNTIREPLPVPLYRDNVLGDDFRKTSECDEIALLDREYVYPSFTTVITIDITKSNSKPQLKNYIGNTQTVYMGEENLYLVSPRTYYSLPSRVWPFIGGIGSGSSYSQSSIITKLSYKQDSISYVASTKFDGTLLNQFSLDEYEGNLRIAGTIGEVSGGKSSNFLKTFDAELNQLAVIDDLARGERVYSVRFNGKTGVVVTFKKVDPLFVFDLSDARRPKLKGELKIPGYSDYLHFINDSTVIGFGKDAIEAQDDLKSMRDIDFAWYQGLKMALFDITDPNNPKELSKVMIGDRGSESPALYDHRAFVYDPKHDVIIVPASVTKIDPTTCTTNQSIAPCYGKPVSQGAQVIRIKEGKELQHAGEISHGGVSASYMSSANDAVVTRALVIENEVVSISGSKITVNEIDSLKQVTSFSLK